ncbi:hypothetical protein JOM56_010065 [Amanita muscaria]
MSGWKGHNWDDQIKRSGRTFYYPVLGGEAGGGKKRGVNDSFGSKWSVGEDTLSGGSGRGKGGHERNPSFFGSLSPERAAAVGGLDLAEFGYRLSRVPRDGEEDGEEERRGEVRWSSESADPDAGLWKPGFPPLLPEKTTEEVEEPIPVTTESPTELEEPIPVTTGSPIEPIPPPPPPPIPPPFPSMSGLRTSSGHRSWLDESDPYLETTGPR